MSKAADFVALLFFARDAAHREHLKTTSFAAHMALGEFYAAVIDLADDFAEAYQGENKRLGDFELIADKVTDIKAELETQLEWIGANRYEVVPKDATALQNIIDEVVSAYQTALYKLSLK